MSGAAAAAGLISALTPMIQGSPGQAMPTLVELLSTIKSESTSEESTQLDELINQLTQTTEQVQQETEQSVAKEEEQQTSGTQTTQRLTAEQEGMLNNQLAELTKLMGSESPYSPEAAKLAGAEATQGAIDQVLRSGTGEVAQAGTGFGAYGSTTQGELATQLGARAAQAGAATELQNVQAFGQLENQRMSELGKQIADLLGTATKANEQTTTDQATTTTGSQDTTGKATTDSTQSSESTQDKTATSDTTGSQTSDTTTESTTESEYAMMGTQDGVLTGLLGSLGGVKGIADKALTWGTGALNKIF